MTKEMMLIFGIALALFLMQAIGGYFQIRDYKKSVSRMHKLGNVGIGQTKGGFFSGNLVLIACNSEGVITGAEVMEGLTFLAHFKPREKLLDTTFAGTHIDTFLALFAQFDKKKKKRYKGYIQAVEALEIRIKHPERLSDDAPSGESEAAAKA